jgi:hypothetical protein
MRRPIGELRWNCLARIGGYDLRSGADGDRAGLVDVVRSPRVVVVVVPRRRRHTID